MKNYYEYSCIINQKLSFLFCDLNNKIRAGSLYLLLNQYVHTIYMFIQCTRIVIVIEAFNSVVR